MHRRLSRRPTPNWAGRRLLSERSKALTAAQRKLSGMRYALTIEFLHNLGWNGFKADRHSIRLFDRWFPARSFVQGDVQRLQALIGPNTQDLKTYLTYWLLGINTAPPDVPISHSNLHSQLDLIGILYPCESPRCPSPAPLPIR